ncbi:MAG TPA: serine hydrolase domain-containing protein [Pyrinomonadaceae bacterium]|nr:serine hydrolase domain-containing protein [Pyrinomonadaceae bacterium]
MKKSIFLLLMAAGFFLTANAQNLKEFAETVKTEHKIPEIAYAVVSSDSVIEMEFLGKRRIEGDFPARKNDRFHIGANTKAITAFIAAQLVKDRKIDWNTKFFDLFPQLKSKSRKAYLKISLKDLLTFRANLPLYTYTFEKPEKKDFNGDYDAQRLQFAEYFLKQKPAKPVDGLTFSNVGYVLAGLMLEKASGKSYKNLVDDLGKNLQIEFGFDAPNLSDNLQTWGYDENLRAVLPTENYKINWLLAAGNINVDLPDYVKFIQLQLQGLREKLEILPQKDFDFLHFGLPKFSFGWFNERDEKTGHQISFNEGNAGAFITKVCIIKEIDRAYIVFTNAATVETSKGVDILLDKMKEKYGR